MKNLKSHFKFSKQERSGIFFLLFALIFIQVGYFLVTEYLVPPSEPLIQDVVTQKKIEAIKDSILKKDIVKVYPFNPNFISDYKGYTLGMSVEEINRLYEFRSADKFVNSVKEFQEVTLVSDSLLNLISPYFKFPEWANNSKQSTVKSNKSGSSNNSKESQYHSNIKIKDLNLATAEELKSVNGIGEKLSARIIKFRDRLGGFLLDDQLYDVYGLEEDVVKRALKQFKVLQVPKIEKININTATAQELSKLVYIQKNVAERIVDYRNRNGDIDSLSELAKIEDFPADRIDRIALYLSLKK